MGEMVWLPEGALGEGWEGVVYYDYLGQTFQIKIDVLGAYTWKGFHLLGREEKKKGGCNS